MTVSLVQSFGGLIHKAGCYTIARTKPRPDIHGHLYLPYKVVHPEIPAGEAIDFLRARRLEPCGGCLRSERDQLVAEREAVTR